MPGTDAAADAPASDATLGSGDFDSPIAYADRLLPDVAPPSRSDAAAAADGASKWPWPNCPAFLPSDGLGHVTTPDQASVLLPADYGDAGPYDDAGTGAGEVFAPDGSPCSSYPWLGSQVADDCVASGPGINDNPFVELPPCSWCLEAGVAVQGPSAGALRYDLCANLYKCIQRTGCVFSSPLGSVSCLCGANSPAVCKTDQSGACAAEELAALEATPATIADVLNQYDTFDPATFNGSCAGALNQMYQDLFTVAGVETKCRPPDAGGGH